MLRPLLSSLPHAKARFLDEAKLTGQLDHPGIPAVHDIGELPDGRPFLVMKLIAGRTLAELLASETVVRESLLPTMLSVRQTVGFAHSRGIVHRDLKPANVMVGSFGEVQVLDWGLGKSVAQTDDPFGFLNIEANRDSGSVSGAAIGSAPYASPEQARGQRDKIDLRSDVFSLGAMLVELMTGAPPHSGDKSWEAARIGDTSDVQTRLAQSTLAPELHPLILACLEADPERRPTDANAVAKRIQEYLSDTRQRVERTETEKQVAIGKAEIAQRKNRTLRGLLAVITLLAVSVVTAITIGYFAVKQQAEETAQREREANLALDAERKALVVTDRAMTLLSGNVVKNLLSQFAKIGPDQLALLDQIGKLYFELSLVKRNTAAALETTASGHYRLADFYITHDKFQEAEPHINLAIEQYAQLISTAENEEHYRHLAASYNDRNFLKKQLGQNPEADMAAAIGTWKRIVEKYPDERDHVWDLAVAEVDLGSWYFTLGRYAESIGAFQIPIDRLRDHSQKHPDQPRYRNTLATILGNQSDAFRDHGDMTKALRNAEEGRELILGVIRQRPGIVQDAHGLAELDTKIAVLCTESGRWEDAAERGREAVARLTRVVDRLKGRLDFQSGLVEAQSAYARVLMLQDKSDEAEKLYLAATERVKLMIAQSQTVRYRSQLISALTAQAKLRLKRGRAKEARALLAEAKTLLPAVSMQPTSESLVQTADIELVSARLEQEEGHEAEAGACLKNARQLLKDAESARPFGIEDSNIQLQLFSVEMAGAIQQKKSDVARSILELATHRKCVTAFQSVSAARMLAQLLARPADAQSENDLAMAFRFLNEAKSQGWRAWDVIERDTTFTPLTTRSEFQKLRGK